MTRQTGRLLEQLLAEVGPIEMGFRIQAYAAHILLAQGYRITEIKSSRHPDLIAEKEKCTIRVEVEADIRGLGLHLPEADDLEALCPRSPDDRGYFTVVSCGPLPRWILVDSVKLVHRKNKLALPLLEALCDIEQSQIWSDSFDRIILENSQHLIDFSFHWLCKQALEQKCLIETCH
jgi:hypothetical protein